MFNNKFNFSAVLAVALCSQASYADLLDDGTTTFRYANYPWIGDKSDHADNIPTFKEGEWAQAVELKYHSGYWNDLIGFDVGAYGVHTIYTKDDANRTQNIDGTSDDGFGGINIAYLKSKYESDGWAVKAGYGQKRRAFETFQDYNYRIVESTSQGGDLELEVGPLLMYGTVFDKTSRREQDGAPERLETFLGEKIDYVSIYGARYNVSEALTFKAERAEAKDYISRTFYNANYVHSFGEIHSLALDGRYGTMKDAGDLFERVPLGQYANDPDGLDASFNEARLTYKNADKGYYTTLWRTDVNGGDFNRLLFSDSHGYWSSNSQLWQWFGLEGETSYGVKAGVNFAKHGIPGFSFHATYVQSDEADGFDDFSRKELRTVAMYNFTQPMLKGLSVVWLHIDHRAEGTPDGVRRTGTVAGPTALAQGTADRIYINYVKKF